MIYEQGDLGLVGPPNRLRIRLGIRKAKVLQFQNKSLQKTVAKVAVRNFLRAPKRLHKNISKKLQLDQLQIALYRKGDHYVWHTDSHRSLPRSITLVALVKKSRDLRGGKLELKDYNGRTIRPELRAGEAIMFPSSMVHRVTKVLAGERVTLTAWIFLRPTPQESEIRTKPKRAQKSN